jgi:hypothetical protein
VSLGNIYGIGTGNGSPTKAKKSPQQQLEPFPDGVTRSQFYYLVKNDYQNKLVDIHKTFLANFLIFLELQA